MHASSHILRTIGFLVLKEALCGLTRSEREVLTSCYHSLESEQLQREAQQLATLQLTKPKSFLRLRIPRLRMNHHIIATDAQALLDCPVMLLIECDRYDRVLDSSVISRN